MEDDPETLVSTGWLADRLGQVRVIDASWHLPDAGRDPAAEYAAAHIPGAVYLDFDSVCDPASPLPHAAPAPEVVAARMAALGVSDGDPVVVYDAAGIFSAPRVWWLARRMGLSGWAVLDGGLPKWRAEGRTLEIGAPQVTVGTLRAGALRPVAADADAVAEALGAGTQVVDARSAARFRGDAPEPRPGLRAGHMPAAHNLPWQEVLAPNGTMRDIDGLRAAFEAAGVDPDAPVVTTCGSGVSAAILSLALERLGNRAHRLYDGSWAEWGAEAGGRPVARGS